MHYTHRQRLNWFITWLFLTVSFCLIGFFLVMAATGYRYNQHVGRWQKTGMLIMKSNPEDSQLIIEGQVTDLSRINRIPNVLPGNYRLQVVRTGYLPWEKLVSVRPGYVVNYQDISLFLEHPTLEPIEDRYEELLDSAFPDDRIRLVDGELWQGSHLVTRFDEPPIGAVLLPTNNHILYLRNNEIRIIETDGTNDQLIYTRKTNGPTPLVVVDDMILLFRDGGETQALRMR